MREDRQRASEATDLQPASSSASCEPSIGNHHNTGGQEILELSSDDEHFASLFQTKTEAKTHETPAIFPIRCNIDRTCVAIFKTKDSFVEHLDAHHDKRKRIICYLCRKRKSFATKKALRHHMKSKHICRRLFECPFKMCLKSYTRKKKMGLHMLSHMNFPNKKRKPI